MHKKQKSVLVFHLLLPAAIERGRKQKKPKGAVIKLLFIYSSWTPVHLYAAHLYCSLIQFIFLRMREKSFRDGLTFLPRVVKQGEGFVYQGSALQSPYLWEEKCIQRKKTLLKKSQDCFEWRRVVELSAGLLLPLAWLFAVILHCKAHFLGF